ncbi:MAG TPA: ABC transporter substrate-binding protein [Terriglobia bacterium]|nr:ABC transporter substrate-binding protein [Terriglobia bacterium]
MEGNVVASFILRYFGKRGLKPATTFLFLLFLTACSHPQEKTTIQMAVGGQTQFIYLPLTLADRLGYFKDEGLTVSISDLRGGSEALAAMMGGSVDMVTGFYEHTIRARSQGKRLVMVTLFDRYPGLVLMVGKQHFDQVHSIRDLVGKPVGVTAPGSSTDQLVKYVLRQNNLDPQSIPVVTGGISTMLAALEQDRVWAGVTVDPLASRLARDGIARTLYDTRTEKGTVDIFGGPWPAGGFYTTVEFIQQHPRTVQSMVNAGVRALRYLKSHSAEEVAAAMPESFWGGDRDQYIQSLRADIDIYSPDGVMPSDGPSNVLKTLSLVDEKVAGSRIDLQETYDNSYVLKVR